MAVSLAILYRYANRPSQTPAIVPQMDETDLYFKHFRQQIGAGPSNLRRAW